jgi:hypothetical protein
MFVVGEREECRRAITHGYHVVDGFTPRDAKPVDAAFPLWSSIGSACKLVRHHGCIHTHRNDEVVWMLCTLSQQLRHDVGLGVVGSGVGLTSVQPGA